MEKYGLLDQRKFYRFAVRFCAFFQGRFLSSLMSAEMTVDSVKILGRQEFRWINPTTIMIDEAHAVFLISEDMRHRGEALGVVIWPKYEIPYVDAFVIKDVSNAAGALQQRNTQIISRFYKGRRVPAPDFFLESLPSGTKVSVALTRTNIEHEIHNLLVLDLE